MDKNSKSPKLRKYFKKGKELAREYIEMKSVKEIPQFQRARDEGREGREDSRWNIVVCHLQLDSSLFNVLLGEWVFISESNFSRRTGGQTDRRFWNLSHKIPHVICLLYGNFGFFLPTRYTRYIDLLCLS